MTTALLDHNTRQSLRSKAELVEDLAERGILDRPSVDEKVKARVERRREWYGRVEDAVLDLTNALPTATEDYESHQLLRFLTVLRRAIEADSRANDSAGRVHLTAMQMADVARRLDRRLEHSVLDDPDEAARYVFAQLDLMGATDLARVLGVSTKTVGAWRAGKPVKQKVERVKLVAQLVSYLHYSMTQTGLLMWFDADADLLGGRSPVHMLDEGVRAAWEPLVSYARGSRGQLAG